MTIVATHKALAIASCLALTACSLAEPSYSLKPSDVATDYGTERTKAETVIQDLQELQGKMLLETDSYIIGSIAAGLAAAIGTVYGLGDDGLAGAAIGGATSAGIGAYQNPQAIAAAYGNAADAVQCSINATDVMAGWTKKPDPKDSASFSKVELLRQESAKLASIGPSLNAMSHLTSNDAIDVAYGFALNNYLSTLGNAQSSIGGFANILEQQSSQAPILLHSAVAEIIARTRKKIITRERDSSKLQPKAITAAGENARKKKNDSVDSLKLARNGFQHHVVPVMIALSAVDTTDKSDKRGLAQKMLELNNRLGPFSSPLAQVEDTDLSALDLATCIEDLK